MWHYHRHQYSAYILLHIDRSSDWTFPSHYQPPFSQLIQDDSHRNCHVLQAILRILQDEYLFSLPILHNSHNKSILRLNRWFFAEFTCKSYNTEKWSVAAFFPCAISGNYQINIWTFILYRFSSLLSYGFLCTLFVNGFSSLGYISKHPAKVLLWNFLRRSIKLQNRFSPLIPTPRSPIGNTIRWFIS